MKFVMAMVLGIFVQGLGLAQAASKPVEFEVASVRQVALAATAGQTGQVRSTGRGSMDEAPDRITYRGVTLKAMLLKAYGVKTFQVSGPGWLDDERYDVSATIPEGATKEQVPEMLKNLLVERFRIVLHTEMKDEPVYVLSVGKGGSKLKAAVDDNPNNSSGSSFDRATGQMKLTFNAETMAKFADFLSYVMERSVTDKTALGGKFDFALQAESAGSFVPLPSSMFAAVREVGLQLEATKVPVQHIVIDQVQKAPTEN
jgi:uncharacterized protein (TIGR03435 family)